jgi:3',5'-cyclic AMP phosphodiesterase CpdA
MTRTPRAVLRIVVAVLVAAIAAVVVRYPRQLFSHLVHWRGAAETRHPYVVDHPAPLARLAVAGDIGHGGRSLAALGRTMSRIGVQAPYDALVLLGDHAYPRGDPDALERTVYAPFGPVLAQGSQLLAVLGNHDVLDGHGEEQLRRLGQPRRWWLREFPSVRVVGIDSNVLADRAQLAFLDRVLAGPVAEVFTVVVLHHPPYSAGYQGSDLATRAVMVPRFERAGVDLVCSAHDHDYQRSVPINGVTYVVTGGASRARFTGRRAWTAASYRERHFVEIAVFERSLVVRAIDADGSVFDEAAIQPRDAVVRDAVRLGS